ncbi:S8 family serine peptidase [Dactylosporangium sp. NPDC000244]|uniref:S8 family serine peptidase n=1 Tax=Dactylosporangium sp. NPDC000244 TaxID=3154365 RepID=UPI00333256C4
MLRETGRWTALALVAAAGGVMLASPAEGSIVGAAGDGIEGSYVVTLKSAGFQAQSRNPVQRKAAVSATANSLSSRYGGTVGLQYSSALQGFSVSGLGEEQAKRLAGDASVESVERDVRFGPKEQSGGRDARAEGTQPYPLYWNLDRIDQRAGSSYSYTYPNEAPSVHAYVVDSGVDKYNWDFGGRATWGRNFVDRVRRPFDPDGRNQSGNNSNDPNVLNDCEGRGTFAAGVLGGAQYGVAKKVQITAVRVADCYGAGFISEIVAGIDYVTYYAVKPAVALFGIGGDRVSPSIDNALRYSIEAGITWTVGADDDYEYDPGGNACYHSPSSVRTALVVGASDVYDNRPAWADYGPCVSLFAPGVWINFTTGSRDGTAMAAPHVAGAAAMILEAHPSYSPDQVRQALLQSSTVGAVKNPGPGSPNRLLFVRQEDPPLLGSRVKGLYNPRFGTSEAYARAKDSNHIVYATWTDEWTGWTDLGGDTTDDPAPLYNPRFGTTEVYTRLSSGHVAYRYYSSGWADWIDLGGDIVGSPAALYNPRFGTTEVYARTTDGHLKYRYFSNGWSEWYDLGGGAASDPALLYNPKFGTTEAYVRGVDGHVKYRYYLNGWADWIDLQGDITGDPQVIFNPKYGTTEVYARTTNDTLAYRYYLGGWAGWIDLGGALNDSPGLVYNPRSGTTEAYVRTASAQIEYVYYLGAWSGWNKLGGSTAVAPSVIYNAKWGTTELYTRTADFHGNVSYYGGGWQPWSDISA